METIKIKLISRGGKTPRVPELKTAGSAACDLQAFLDDELILAPHARALVPTGLCVQIPAGFAGLILARSGLASRNGIAMANGVGLIDSDYRGELKVPVVNLSGEAFTLRDGDRFAQFMLTPVPAFCFEQADALDETARGEQGFGSTGVK